MNITDGKAATWLDWLKVAAATVVAVGGPILGLGNETAFLVVTVLVIAAAAGVLAFGHRWTRESPAGLQVGESPARVLALPGWTRTAAKWVIAVVPALFCLVWWVLWGTIFPLANVTDFQGSEHSGGSGNTFIKSVPVHVIAADGKRYRVYPAVKFLVAKVPAEKVYVHAVNIVAEPFAVQATETVFGAYPEIINKAVRYLATVPSAGGTTEAQLYQDGGPAEAILVLSDSNPAALIHVDFEGGKGGVYSVHAEVVISDAKGGQRRVLTTDKRVIVSVPAPFAELKEENRTPAPAAGEKSHTEGKLVQPPKNMPIPAGLPPNSSRR